MKIPLEDTVETPEHIYRNKALLHTQRKQMERIRSDEFLTGILRWRVNWCADNETGDLTHFMIKIDWGVTNLSIPNSAVAKSRWSMPQEVCGEVCGVTVRLMICDLELCEWAITVTSYTRSQSLQLSLQNNVRLVIAMYKVVDERPIHSLDNSLLPHHFAIP